MSDINFTDRDLTEVKEHDKNRKSQEARKIRFTGKTAEKIANKWINHYKKKAVQTAQELKAAQNSYDSYVNYINNDATTVDEKYISILENKINRLENLKFIYERKAKNSFLFFKTFGVLTKKKQESKAVKLKEKMFSTMKKNGNLIFGKGKDNENEEINIDSINQDNVKQMVDDMFREQSNDYNNEITQNDNNFSSSIYRMKKDEIIQDELGVPGERAFTSNLGENVEFSPPAISEFQSPSVVVPPVYNGKLETPEQKYNFSFDNRGTGVDLGNTLDSYEEENNYYNREPVEITPERNEVKEEVKSAGMELNDKVDDFINKADNGGISIEDLEQLRRALDAERNKSKELKRELEEKRIKEAEATREAERAEQAKQEKLRFVNDALNAYKEENERLINESRQLDESAQQKISKKQQAMSTIASLNEMIGPTAVNIRTSNSNNTYKGK